MVRRDGSRVRCFTRNGYDCGPLPGIVDAASRIKATSFLIDGEVVITSDERLALWLLDLDQRRHASRFEDRNSRAPSLMR
jgi:ATP-dependent DNA ligase